MKDMSIDDDTARKFEEVRRLYRALLNKKVDNSELLSCLCDRVLEEIYREGL